jgi:glycosyltransferase involved in cell wall biosynthesis
MNVLFQSYNLCMQNQSGGINTRIKSLYNHLTSLGVNVTYFSKFTDKVIDYDILHIFKVNIENQPLIDYAKSHGVKIVISSVVPCNDIFKIKANMLLCRILPITTGLKIIQCSLKAADAIISETEEEKLFLSKHYGIDSNKISVIPNGIDDSFIAADFDNLIYEKLCSYEKYVLCVGRFDENKNQLNLIKAMNNTGITTVLIGGPSPDSNTYYDKCRELASDNIKFLGWINHNDPLLMSAYRNAHVFVIPSYYETFGISILEAGCCGANIALSKTLPILSYGIFSDFTFNPKNIKDIQKCIIKAYNSPLNNFIGEKVRDMFSWNRVAKEHVDLYTALLKE